MAREIKQSVTFNASQKTLYEALMDPKKHATYTGGKTRIEAKVGGKFSVYDGYIQGVNVELIAGKRIVQAWRGSDWPKGAYSIATFEFASAGKGKTRLDFTQHGVPVQFRDSIAKGWKDYYWTPMKLWLKSLQ